ncbi:helix-turn-helix transcriptional regulator [Novosphingobium piscinae]|uniref:Helix-turn-helix transcriptional regulator n=2 Tax=Novosphingobium piscinae TaxID=1507448 RepID=A0A7X1G0Y6_9SPHN|nr:helix-turn-helix domain-containing protein [Novosphingobium piscinae]MBC2670611.1 helix-turn-helix transcriptional regulator [Novosphingobium piscinae]
MGFAPQACPIRTILDQVAAKWTVLILLELHDGPKRFNALLRALPDISRRMLTQGLRDLEQNGLLRRTVFDTRPPAVEYALTALGESLMGPLLGLVDWATTHREAVFAAQRQYQDSQSD